MSQYKYDDIKGRSVIFIEILEDKKPFKKGDITWVLDVYEKHIGKTHDTSKGYIHPEGNRYGMNFCGTLFKMVPDPRIKKDSLLTEAKKRYPVGTVFIPAHICTENVRCIITEDTYFDIEPNENTVIARIKGGYGADYSKHKIYGGSDYMRNVYYDGKWAKIVEIPKDNREDLIAKAKKDYPIGCLYKCAKFPGDWEELKDDDVVYKYNKGHIYAHDGGGSLYCPDKGWAPVRVKEAYFTNPKEVYPTNPNKFKPDMKEIQKECKRRFPIGCTYKSTRGGTFTLQKDSTTYEIMSDNIYGHSGGGSLYDYGKWAELLEYPKPSEPTKPEYKVNHWVKCVGGPWHQSKGQGYKEGRVFKISKISSDSYRQLLWSDDHDKGVFSDHVRLASGLEIHDAQLKDVSGERRSAIITSNKPNGIHYYSEASIFKVNTSNTCGEIPLGSIEYYKEEPVILLAKKSKVKKLIVLPELKVIK